MVETALSVVKTALCMCKIENGSHLQECNTPKVWQRPINHFLASHNSMYRIVQRIQFAQTLRVLTRFIQLLKDKQNFSCLSSPPTLSISTSCRAGDTHLQTIYSSGWVQTCLLVGFFLEIRLLMVCVLVLAIPEWIILLTLHLIDCISSRFNQSEFTRPVRARSSNRYSPYRNQGERGGRISVHDRLGAFPNRRFQNGGSTASFFPSLSPGVRNLVLDIIQRDRLSAPTPRPPQWRSRHVRGHFRRWRNFLTPLEVLTPPSTKTTTTCCRSATLSMTLLTVLRRKIMSAPVVARLAFLRRLRSFMSRSTTLPVQASDPKTLKVPKWISDVLSAEMTSLLPGTESLALNKKFPLSFEDTDFVIQIPKLDGWFARLAKLRDLKKDLGAAEEVMTKTQLKILDIAPPPLWFICTFAFVPFLLDNNNNSDNLLYAKNALEAILKQWVRDFAFMSHQRRRATVSLVQPDIEHLLSDKGSFDKGKETRDFLFTNLFVDKMYRSAKVDKTVGI